MASHPSGQDRAPFITFEGGEGSGKSTQIQVLSQRLQDCGLTVVATREPGGSVGAEDIRQLLVTGPPERWSPLTEVLLNYAARQEHLEHTVRPALTKGDWVLCDRFSDSTLAYQGYAGGVDHKILKQLDDVIVKDWTPDLTVVLDLDPAEGLRRAGVRGDQENRFEQKGLIYHQDIRDAFLKIAGSEPHRCHVIDGEGTVDQVADEIWQLVTARFDPAALEAK